MGAPEALKHYSIDAARTKEFVPGASSRWRGEREGIAVENQQHLFHAIMGMAGEAAEIMAVKFGTQSKEELDKELGDWLWYAEMGLQAIGSSLEEIENMRWENTPHIAINSGANIEILKKWLFYGKEIDHREIKENILKGYTWVRRMCGTEAEFVSVLAKNILKLRKRFPEKFTEADAIARVDA